MSAPAHDDAPIEELEARAKAAVQAFRDAKARTSRGPDGRLLPGNAANLRTGLRSLQIMGHPDVSAWHAAQVEAIEADLGGAAELSVLQRGLVRETARVELILMSLGEEIQSGGVLTGKGKNRAATLTFLKTLDRFTNLCRAIGVQRRTKAVASFAEAVRRG